MDMHVDKHRIKLWSISEVEQILSSQGIGYDLRFGFGKNDNHSEIPIFLVKGLKSK